MPSRRRAPPGCYWEGKVLWGRAMVAAHRYRWSLHTDDPKTARERREAGRQRLIAATIHGDARLTLGEAVVAWEPWVRKQVGALTVERYLCSMFRLAPHLEGKHLDEVNGKFIAEIIRIRQSVDNVTNATIKRDLGALSSVMNFAIDQGWREDNPVLPRLRRVKERRDPISLPRPEDVAKVVARAPGMFKDLILAARATGCRQSELANARRSQLDLRAKTLTVVGKGNKVRVINLVPMGGVEVFAALPDAVGNAPMFWHGDGERYANVASRFALFTAQIAENDPEFRRFRFHDLRHLHAVEWLQSGRSLYNLQQRLGHTSIKTTEVYLKFLTPEQQLSVKFGDAGGPKIGRGVSGDVE